MRFTASILAILVLILSCLPCADADCIVIANAETQIEINILTEQDEENHDYSDLCSPFCICACCVSYSLINESVIIPLKAETPTCLSFIEFLSDDVNQISLPIWQPPK